MLNESNQAITVKVGMVAGSGPCHRRPDAAARMRRLRVVDGALFAGGCVMRYYLTRRSLSTGSGKWITSRWVERIVEVPDGARTRDLRSRGVRVLYESPVLATWWAPRKSSRWALTPSTREYYASLAAIGGYDTIARSLGVTLEAGSEVGHG